MHHVKYKHSIYINTHAGVQTIPSGRGRGPDNAFLIINVFHRGSYGPHREAVGPLGSNCFSWVVRTIERLRLSIATCAFLGVRAPASAPSGSALEYSDCILHLNSVQSREMCKLWNLCRNAQVFCFCTFRMNVTKIKLQSFFRPFLHYLTLSANNAFVKSMRNKAHIVVIMKQNLSCPTDASTHIASTSIRRCLMQ